MNKNQILILKETVDCGPESSYKCCAPKIFKILKKIYTSLLILTPPFSLALTSQHTLSPQYLTYPHTTNSHPTFSSHSHNPLYHHILTLDSHIPFSHLTFTPLSSHSDIPIYYINTRFLTLFSLLTTNIFHPTLSPQYLTPLSHLSRLPLTPHSLTFLSNPILLLNSHLPLTPQFHNPLCHLTLSSTLIPHSLTLLSHPTLSPKSPTLLSHPNLTLHSLTLLSPHSLNPLSNLTLSPLSHVTQFSHPTLSSPSFNPLFHLTLSTRPYLTSSLQSNTPLFCNALISHSTLILIPLHPNLIPQTPTLNLPSPPFHSNPTLSYPPHFTLSSKLFHSILPLQLYHH